MAPNIATTEALSAATARSIRLAREIAGIAARDHWLAGRHVTELELAGTLSVSRTPVRAALRVLESYGALEARPGRGFFLVRNGDELPALPFAPPVTFDDALRVRLLRDRLSGALPASMTAGLLAARYDAGRAVLERVLRRLADDGLLTREAGHTWQFVRSLEGERGVRASYELRLLAEPGALLLPGATIVLDEVVRQRQRHLEMIDAITSGSRQRQRQRRWQRPSAAALFDLDAGFHEALAGFSGNGLVANLVRHQNELRKLLEFDSYNDTARVVGWAREHLSILDSLMAGKVTAASRRLRAHLIRAAAIATGHVTDLQVTHPLDLSAPSGRAL